MKASRRIMLLVTLGCVCAYSPLFAQAIGVQHISNAHPDDLAISVDAIGTVPGPNRLNGISVKYNADGTDGGGWFANTGTNMGWNAGDAQGISLSPINASAFN
ncbi:MAG: hypothetical protein WBG49_21575, partial [Thermoanaerobaculia bacterium]